MSLATLARKTKAKQRVRTRGNFILNMTGRGNVLGMNAKMSRGNCGGKLTKCAGKRAACCVGVPGGGCVEKTQDNTFTVGYDLGSAPSTFYGYFTGVGSLIPLNLKDYNLKWLGWQKGGSFPPTGTFYVSTVNGTTQSLPQNYFTSITFVDCSDNSIRTYNTADVTLYSGTGGSSGGSISPTWEWGIGSPYTDDEAYWTDASGRTLKVYIDTVPSLNEACGCPKPCCRFKHGGRPAPQMGYGVYLNRKSKGAYHPGGGPQCCTKPNATSGKIVWKQGSNLDASVVITNKKDNVLACNSDVYTAKRDTCTGCATDCDDPNNNFTVGYQSTFDFWGYDNTGGTSTGDLVPNTIDGSGIRYMGYQTTGSFPNQFYINFDSSGGVTTPPKDFFNSITFANCNDNSTRTYYTDDATYHSQDPSGYTGPGAGSLGGLGCPTWRWDASTNPVTPGGGYSGYTILDELAYWDGVSGENLQVFINNTNPNLCCSQCCCPVKKNICGCRATDLVRYTRINKSFGCQTTKAVRNKVVQLVSKLLVIGLRLTVLSLCIELFILLQM